MKRHPHEDGSGALSASITSVASLRHEPEARARALHAYKHTADLPLLALALVIIPIVVLPLVFDLPAKLDVLLTATDWTIWTAFVVDLAVKTYLAEHRARSFMTNWLDVVIVAVSLPVFLVDLRPLRVLRSGRVLGLLRLTRVVAFSTRFFAHSRQLAGRNGFAYVMMIATALLFAGAALVYLFERSGSGDIDDFGTALWWSVVTVTTVGYGDVFPTSPEARVVAALLMILGISVFGFVTANIAAFFVELAGDESKANMSEVLAKLESLELEIQALRRELTTDEPHELPVSPGAAVRRREGG